MTTKQKEVLDFISQYIDTHGYSPKLKDIASNMGCVHSAVVFHMDKLEQQGYIERLPGHRGVRILEK